MDKVLKFGQHYKFDRQKKNSNDYIKRNKSKIQGYAWYHFFCNLCKKYLCIWKYSSKNYFQNYNYCSKVIYIIMLLFLNFTSQKSSLQQKSVLWLRIFNFYRWCHKNCKMFPKFIPMFNKSRWQLAKNIFVIKYQISNLEKLYFFRLLLKTHYTICS